MRLYQICEDFDEYEGLDDSDQFGDTREMVAMIKFKNWIEANWFGFGMEKRRKMSINDFDGAKPVVAADLDRILLGIYGEEYWEAQFYYAGDPSHEDLDIIYDVIRNNPDLTEWWGNIAEKPERLEPSYGKYPDESIGEDFDEYEGLDDVDKFEEEDGDGGPDYRMVGEFTLEPHCFVIWEWYEGGEGPYRDASVDNWDNLEDIPQSLLIKMCGMFKKVLPRDLLQRLNSRRGKFETVHQTTQVSWLADAAMLYWQHEIEPNEN